jgi:putative membrane protein
MSTSAIITVLAAALGQTDHQASAWVIPAPTSGDIMLHGLLAATLYGLLGIVLMVVGFKLFDMITPKIDVQKELAENRNMAVAIVVGAMLIGLALMLGHVIAA